MILKQIDDYVHEMGFISLRALCQKFDMEPEALEPMMETLERKGKVKRFDNNTLPWDDDEESGCTSSACHRCKGCGTNPDPSSQIVYQGL
ncbi:FeoC-like transcriptional regulator [Verrucomicrobiota bacterium]